MWMSYVLVILTFNLCVSQENNNSLKLLQVLFRHGDRTPTETYTNDPYKNWKEGWGTLTNKGKRQLYKLGQLLRDKYGTFLPKCHLTKHVYVRSSYADRCIMSAQTLLAGLFPPEAEEIWNPSLLWQPIPVKYVPRNEDNVIAMKKKCPVYDNALKAAYQSSKIKELNEANNELYHYLTNVTGDPMYDINSVEFLYNTLEIEMQNNLTLPEWTKNVSMERLREIAKTNLAIFSDTELMKRFTGGSFLNDVISNIKKKIDISTDLEVILFSGHDITVVTILRTLGFEQLIKPDWGAFMVFELHDSDNSDYEIKILYGKNYESAPQQLDLKFCENPCMLQDFVKGLQAVLPEDWNAECLKV